MLQSFTADDVRDRLTSIDTVNIVSTLLAGFSFGAMLELDLEEDAVEFTDTPTPATLFIGSSTVSNGGH